MRTEQSCVVETALSRADHEIIVGAWCCVSEGNGGNGATGAWRGPRPDVFLTPAHASFDIHGILLS